MNEIWENLVTQFTERIEQALAARMKQLFERFFRQGVQLVFSEEEAARLLNVSPFTVAKWRRDKQINHYLYTARPTYGLHHLQDFLARNEHKHLTPLFEPKKDIALWGVETENTKNTKGAKLDAGIH